MATPRQELISPSKYLTNTRYQSVYGMTTAVTFVPTTWLTSVPSGDTDVGWFWTKDWQEGEREADADREAGRFRDIETIDELISFLNDSTEERTQ